MGTDGQTDVTKLIVAFRSFANAPKKSTFRPGAIKCAFKSCEFSSFTRSLQTPLSQRADT